MSAPIWAVTRLIFKVNYIFTISEDTKLQLPCV